MPKPAYPISGDPIPATWGTELVDFVGEHLRFVRNPLSDQWQINNAVGGGTGSQALIELTHLPVNDPNIVAADLACVFRCDSGGAQGQCARLFDYQATPPADNQERCRNYWSGVGQRGGMTGSIFVRVGGVNNRQIWWRADNCTGTSFWLVVYGWWIAEKGIA